MSVLYAQKDIVTNILVVAALPSVCVCTLLMAEGRREIVVLIATARALVNAKAMAAGLGLRFVRVVLAEPSTSSIPIPDNTRGEQLEMRKRPAPPIFEFRWL